MAHVNPVYDAQGFGVRWLAAGAARPGPSRCRRCRITGWPSGGPATGCGSCRCTWRWRAISHCTSAVRRPPDRVYRMKSFTLWRFLPPFVRDRGGQHIGETITDHRGQVAYLKTFRLSDPQIRRGHLLRTLAGADWELDRAAAALGSSREELIRRLRAAGFSALLKGGV